MMGRVSWAEWHSLALACTKAARSARTPGPRGFLGTDCTLLSVCFAGAIRTLAARAERRALPCFVEIWEFGAFVAAVFGEFFPEGFVDKARTGKERGEEEEFGPDQAVGARGFGTEVAKFAMAARGAELTFHQDREDEGFEKIFAGENFRDGFGAETRGGEAATAFEPAAHEAKSGVTDVVALSNHFFARDVDGAVTFGDVNEKWKMREHRVDVV